MEAVPWSPYKDGGPGGPPPRRRGSGVTAVLRHARQRLWSPGFKGTPASATLGLTPGQGSPREEDAHGVAPADNAERVSRKGEGVARQAARSDEQTTNIGRVRARRGECSRRPEKAPKTRQFVTFHHVVDSLVLLDKLGVTGSEPNKAPSEKPRRSGASPSRRVAATPAGARRVGAGPPGGSTRRRADGLDPVPRRGGHRAREPISRRSGGAGPSSLAGSPDSRKNPSMPAGVKPTRIRLGISAVLRKLWTVPRGA